LIGQAALVTDQSPVAYVAIFKRPAIDVLITCAFHLKTDALSILAGIGHGARVTVVAKVDVELRLAPAQSVAEIVGTRVAIIANDRQANATALFTMVTDRARIAVDAFALAQIHVGTTSFAVASIGGARVIIIAKVDIIATHLGRLVGLSVAVIVKAIAQLLSGSSSVTSSETICVTEPLSLADAEFIGDFTRCPESQVNGLLRTRANTRVCHALQCVDPIDCDCRQT